MQQTDLSNRTIAVVGLGYVGLPLAIEYGKKYRVIGFDIYEPRVKELLAGRDHTMEADLDGLRCARELYETTKKTGLTLTSDIKELEQVNTYIVTVPTPIDRFNNPDLTPLLKASATIGKTLRKGTSLYTRVPSIRAVRRRTACLYWKKRADYISTRTSSAGTALSASIPATR